MNKDFSDEEGISRPSTESIETRFPNSCHGPAWRIDVLPSDLHAEDICFAAGSRIEDRQYFRAVESATHSRLCSRRFQARSDCLCQGIRRGKSGKQCSDYAG